MATSFSALKQARSNSFDKLNSQLQSMGSATKKGGDDRFWKPDVDKAGNGYAVIRFLPAPQGEDMPFVRMWDHGFQGTGGWYIENSLTTINLDDPCSEYNSKLWNSGHDEDKEQARKQKRRLSYVANIYVVSDPSNPSREGQTYLYKFGKKIFDKLNDAMNPSFADEAPINPFDFWEGADFKLKIRQVEGYRNYDKSEFSAVNPLTEASGTVVSDEDMEGVWNKAHSLSDIIDPKNFKSYTELKTKLYKVLGLDGRDAAPSNTASDDVGMEFSANFKERATPEAPTSAARPSVEASSDDDDSLDFFKSLAEE